MHGLFSRRIEPCVDQAVVDVDFRTCGTRRARRRDGEDGWLAI